MASQQLEDGSWKPDTQFINEGATNRYNSDVLRITAYLAWALKDTGYQGLAVEKAKQFIHVFHRALFGSACCFQVIQGSLDLTQAIG